MENLLKWTSFIVSLLAASSAFANVPTQTKTKNPFHFFYTPGSGLTLTNKDKTTSFNFSFLTQPAYSSIANANELRGGTNIPRAKLYFTANYYNWSFDFSYNYSKHYKLDSLNLSYQWKWGNVSLGRETPSFGLSNMVDDDALIFIQDSLPANTFTPGYAKTFSFNANSAHFIFQSSVFLPGYQENTSGSDPLGESVRLIYLPWHTPKKVLHLELSLWHQGIDHKNQTSFGTTPEFEPKNGASLIGTPTINNATKYNVADLVALDIDGPLSVQGEYMNTWVNRNNSESNLHFSGAYLEASYFLTGESRNYNYPGAYMQALNHINHPGYGAWEVAARASTLDLNSRNIKGGRETNYTLGLNWYINRVVRLTANYIRAYANQSGSDDVAANIYALEAQLRF